MFSKGLTDYLVVSVRNMQSVTISSRLPWSGFRSRKYRVKSLKIISANSMDDRVKPFDVNF
ncbi:hypothetical protein SAMN05216516_11459 [Izhakiella capsodis]|uniref:Uncharacterized protein n=1 Tax=Izhakiella capsodis TaxID=1367852 RepID=A0A1I5B4P6_9GAMM|nr:hypothetical protein SAMN05216516_11459 [Izhakiella capsodis]